MREATEATWAEIEYDAGTWTISPARRKDTRSRIRRKQVQSQPHVVPLPRQALKLLDEVREAERARRDLAGVTAAVSASDFIFVGERGGKPQNWDRWLKLWLNERGCQVGRRTRFAALQQRLQRTSEPNLTSFRFYWGIRTLVGN